MIILKNPKQIAMLRQSGQILAQTFRHLEPLIKEGVSTQQLDWEAAAFIRSCGAQPSFYNYHGYPASICSSINHVVIHGIPSASQILRSGDLLSLDIGVNLDGFFTDSAHSYLIGQASEPLKKLLEATRESLNRAIAAVSEGGRIKDIGRAVTEYIRPFGYGIVESYCGHGVGLALHEDPPIVNVYPSSGGNPRIRNGMVLAIEPMICLGSGEVDTLEDNFTVVTCDGRHAAHFEHTIALVEGKVEILTL